MPWNETRLARSQRLRAEYLMAGMRYARTRRSQRTPGASARFTPLGRSVSKTVPRSNRSFIVSGALATPEVTHMFGPSATDERGTERYRSLRTAPMPKDGYTNLLVPLSAHFQVPDDIAHPLARPDAKRLGSPLLRRARVRTVTRARPSAAATAPHDPERQSPLGSGARGPAQSPQPDEHEHLAHLTPPPAPPSGDRVQWSRDNLPEADPRADDPIHEARCPADQEAEPTPSRRACAQEDRPNHEGRCQRGDEEREYVTDQRETTSAKTAAATARASRARHSSWPRRRSFRPRSAIPAARS